VDHFFHVWLQVLTSLDDFVEVFGGFRDETISFDGKPTWSIHPGMLQVGFPYTLVCSIEISLIFLRQNAIIKQ